MLVTKLKSVKIYYLCFKNQIKRTNNVSVQPGFEIISLTNWSSRALSVEVKFFLFYQKINFKIYPMFYGHRFHKKFQLIWSSRLASYS